MAVEEGRGEAYEAEHVHAVYEQIASHFSSTRYKPWPIVERFLNGLPDGSVGLDIGCGNGKYLAVNPNIFIVGSDRSTNLTKIAAKHQPHAAVVADNLMLPHAPEKFDFAISIAVVHHLSTPVRRIEAVKAILEVLRPSSVEEHGGKALIYVWALEQKDSRRGWDESHAQDVMVPWVMKTKSTAKKQPKHKKSTENEDPEETHAVASEQGSEERQTSTSNETIFQRYYHLYRKGELEHNIELAGGQVLESGYEKDNWWAVATRKPE